MDGVALHSADAAVMHFRREDVVFSVDLYGKCEGAVGAEKMVARNVEGVFAQYDGCDFVDIIGEPASPDE